MDRQQIFDYVKQHYGTLPDYPWADQNVVLRHRSNQKWYALLMEVGRDKLSIPGEGMVDVINVKCDPMLIGSLRLREGFHPAYHMNKDKWISVRLDGTVPWEDIRRLLDGSYVLTGTKKNGVKREAKKEESRGLERRNPVSDLRKIPGIGENMERHLHNIGIQCIEDLKGKSPEELYHLDCLKKGFQDDRCVLYVFRCAVYYAEHEQRAPEKLKWWYWKDKEYPEKNE